jgi:hypothetical protein
MGTRGFIGFIINGKEKISYNQFDSSPSSLGAGVMLWTELVDMGAARKQASALCVVTGRRRPTARHIDLLRPYLDTELVTDRASIDWYTLLRSTQGDPAAILACGYVEDASAFPLDSLFAEWGYLVDFDTGQLEVYRGCQDAPHHDGRFADRRPLRDGYWPVRQVASIPLDQPDFAAMRALEDATDETGVAPCRTWTPTQAGAGDGE